MSVFPAMGLLLAMLLSGCACTCARPPEVSHFTIDGYHVTVELSSGPAEHYSKQYSSTATSDIAPNVNADATSSPLWKAIEIVASEKCPNGYFWIDRDRSPPDPTRISAKWACGG
jgi:hypothetical protein